LADVKLVVEGDLADPKRGLVVEKRLLQPQIMEARRGQRFDRADGQQVIERVPRQAAAAYPIPICVKACARPV
jgi:hypothetical protein